MSSLILLRGLPGSGKSTLAEVLSECGKYPVLSIDSYFTNEQGEYKFEFADNHLAYKSCEQMTREELEKKAKKIFVDNTFTLEWELAPYFKLASEFNYRIFVVTVENHHDGGNIHGITSEQIDRMRKKYRVRL